MNLPRLPCNYHRYPLPTLTFFFLHLQISPTLHSLLNSSPLLVPWAACWFSTRFPTSITPRSIIAWNCRRQLGILQNSSNALMSCVSWSSKLCGSCCSRSWMGVIGRQAGSTFGTWNCGRWWESSEFSKCTGIICVIWKLHNEMSSVLDFHL